jgi:hypothetical protein
MLGDVVAVLVRDDGGRRDPGRGVASAARTSTTEISAAERLCLRVELRDMCGSFVRRG